MLRLTPTSSMAGKTRGLHGNSAQPDTAADAPAAAAPAAGSQAAGSQAAEPRPADSHAAVRRPVMARVAQEPRAESARPGVASLPIQFDTGSDQIIPASAKAIDQLGKALSEPEYASAHFRIEGHTDTTGTKEHNDELSRRRAAAVTDYLVSHFGLDRTRLEPVGLGESQLLVVTSDGVPEIRNRRVQIVNLGQ